MSGPRSPGRPWEAPTGREASERVERAHRRSVRSAGSEFWELLVSWRVGEARFRLRRKALTDVSASERGRKGTVHVIGYIRVSTEEQERSGLGVEAQLDAIHAECERRGWTVEVLADLGCSGKQVNAQLRRALDLLRTGQAEALVVAKIDRLARSVLHASEILVAAQRQHWNLVLLDLAVDLATPQGRAMAQMLATFAELEREMISTRTREALAARARRGERNGRPSAIPAGLLRRIVISREAGRSFKSIAAELTQEQHLTPTGLTTWNESTVRRAYSTAVRAA